MLWLNIKSEGRQCHFPQVTVYPITEEIKTCSACCRNSSHFCTHIAKIFCSISTSHSARIVSMWMCDSVTEMAGGFHFAIPPPRCRVNLMLARPKQQTSNIWNTIECSHHFQEFQVILKSRVYLHLHQVPNNKDSAAHIWQWQTLL